MSFRIFFALVFSAQLAAAESVQTCKLLAITDGDTVLAKCQQSTERVRLIGIDAPELGQGEHSAWQAKQYGVSDSDVRKMGKFARKHLANLISVGANIQLRQDREARDKFGRLLAYVYTADGVFVNSKMISDGYAGTMSIKPNTTYATEFSTLYQIARQQKRGLWSTSNE